LTSALEGGEGSASRPGRTVPPGKTRYPLYRRLSGPQGWAGPVPKISPPSEFDLQTIQPIGSHWVIMPCHNHSTKSPYLFIHHRLYIILAIGRIVNAHKKNNIMYHATCNSLSYYLVGAHSILESTDSSHIQSNIITYEVPSIVQIRKIKKTTFQNIMVHPWRPHISHK